ncbi:Txe/YoeB family addiction module toxin [Geovibrio sp. ADMFC3]|jgi:toxin YoeB
MIVWTETAWDEYLYWQKNDRKILKRINELIRDIHRSPFEGIGKPEALKFSLAGKWSRRIDHEHRLVYQIDNSHIVILQCKYHY